MTVRRSKSDQDGNGATLYVGIAAATALREIHSPAASADARIFGLRSGRPETYHRRRSHQGRGMKGRTPYVVFKAGIARPRKRKPSTGKEVNAAA